MSHSPIKCILVDSKTKIPALLYLENGLIVTPDCILAPGEDYHVVFKMGRKKYQIKAEYGDEYDEAYRVNPEQLYKIMSEIMYDDLGIHLQKKQNHKKIKI